MLVPWWIMAAWAYEQADPIISDAMFDKIAMRLAKEWNKVEHKHKALLDKKSLKTSLAIGGKWPLISQHAAIGLQNICHSKRKSFELNKRIVNGTHQRTIIDDGSIIRQPSTGSKSLRNVLVGSKGDVQGKQPKATPSAGKKVSNKLEASDDRQRSASDRKGGRSSRAQTASQPDGPKQTASKTPSVGVKRSKTRWAIQRQ